MQVVRPPLIGFAFYVGQDIGRQTVKMVRTLQSSFRARYRGVAFLEFNSGRANAQPYSLDELERLVEGHEPRALSIYVDGATTTTGRTEIIESKDGVLSLSTLGAPFFEPSGGELDQQAAKIGKRLYKCFTTVAGEIAAFYGSIWLVRPFQSPEQMIAQPTDSLLGDSFLNSDLLGDAFVGDLSTMLGSDVYLEALKNGIYFSTHAELNPRHQEVAPLVWEKRSTRIAQKLAAEVARLAPRQK